MIRTHRQFAALSARQRFLSFGAAVGFNCAALAMLIMLRSQPPVIAGNADGGLISVSVATAPKSEKLSPVIIPDIRLRTEAFEIPADVSATAVSAEGTSDDCPVIDSIAKGIMADPAALDAVIHAPAEARSVADAIVIWNSAWDPATAGAQSALGPVRTNVMATLQTLSEDCLSPVVSGPRLIAVPNGERTLILVFGSGDWSWNKLIESVPAESDPA